jgi:hypothetical protein
LFVMIHDTGRHMWLAIRKQGWSCGWCTLVSQLGG